MKIIRKGKRVHVTDMKTGQRAALVGGDTVPEWADHLVTNPDVLEEEDLLGDEAENDELDDMDADELRAFAEENDVDVSRLRAEDSIRAAIRTALA